MYKAAFAHGAHDYEKYHVIDLDPYGTAGPFLDAAVEAVHDGGMICVTCTDAGVFASSGYLEKTYALYGGLPIKGNHSHEGGLRLILHAIATTAARYGKSIEPLLSLSIDFYARVFVRIHKSAEDTKLLAGKVAVVQQCDSGCGAWTVQPIARNHVRLGRGGNEFFKYSAAQTIGSERCDHCGFKTHIAGPMWMGPLHNPFFISKILSCLDDLDRSIYGTVPRIEGMLTSALDELDVIEEINKLSTVNSSSESPLNPDTTTATTTTTDTTTDSVSQPQPTTSNIIPYLPASIHDPHPFHFNPSAVSKVLHCVAPPEAALKGALRALGYATTRSHTKPGTIKTQAPWRIIWHVMREWVRQKAPIKIGNQKRGTAGWEILGLGAGDGDATDENTAAGADAGAGEGDQDARTPESKAENEQRLPEVSFDTSLGRDTGSAAAAAAAGASGNKKRKLIRYQSNPRANWGPMAKASASK